MGIRRKLVGVLAAVLGATAVAAAAAIELLGVRAAYLAIRRARAAAARARPYAGEFAFGAADGEATVVGVFGDSVACGLGASSVERTFAGVVASELSGRGRVVCRFAAECGAQASDLARQRVAGDERLAFVSIGTNDALHRADPAEVERALSAFLDRLSHAERVVVFGPGDVSSTAILPPALRPLFRRRLFACEEAIARAVARHPNARHVGPTNEPWEVDVSDFSEDGFHPSDRGMRRIGEAMLRRLS